MLQSIYYVFMQWQWADDAFLLSRSLFRRTKSKSTELYVVVSSKGSDEFYWLLGRPKHLKLCGLMSHDFIFTWFAFHFNKKKCLSISIGKHDILLLLFFFWWLSWCMSSVTWNCCVASTPTMTQKRSTGRTCILLFSFLAEEVIANYIAKLSFMNCLMDGSNCWMFSTLAMED